MFVSAWGGVVMHTLVLVMLLMITTKLKARGNFKEIKVNFCP